MKAELNLASYIKETKFKKLSDILVCLPTYKSYELTKSTVITFLNQKNVNLDILIVGDEDDIGLLQLEFPELNYIKTKENFGGTANKLIGIDVALKNNYTYSMINDNDAFFCNEYGFEKLLNALKNSKNYIIRPSSVIEKYHNHECFESEKMFCLFHCCLVKTEIFNKIPLPDINYFLIHDDISFSCHFLTKYKILIHPEVFYYHPIKLSFYKFSNFHKFYFIRGTLLGLKVEPKNFLIYDNYLRMLLGNIVFVLNSFINFDFSFFKIFKICLIQVINNDYYFPELPKDKFSYIKIGEFESEHFFEYPSYYERIFMPKYIFLTDVYYKKTEVYQKINNL